MGVMLSLLLMQATQGWSGPQMVIAFISSLSVAATIALAKLVIWMRDEIREIKRDVSGKDGKNGLKSDSAQYNARLDELEEWRIKLDLAAKLEREMYEGPERRQEARRLRDKLLEQTERRQEDK